MASAPPTPPSLAFRCAPSAGCGGECDGHASLTPLPPLPPPGPPCKGFTPKLAETYKKLQASKPGVFEIVFVSSDRDQKQFDEYLGEMRGRPYSDRDTKAALEEVQGARDTDVRGRRREAGETITTEGREAVGSDLDGESFRGRRRRSPRRSGVTF